MDEVVGNERLSAAATDAVSRGRLAGAEAWLISDGRAGNIAQLRGVAQALDVSPKTVDVAPRGLWRTLSPWLGVSPSEKLGRPGGLFEAPWPALAMATGRASIPYIRALKRLAGHNTFTLVLQDPRSGPKTADMIWVPAHDRRRGNNVFTTLTSPHVYASDRLEALRNDVPGEISDLPHPRVLVSVGGRNKVYRYGDEDHRRLQSGLKSLRELGASFMITASRRSHDALIAAVREGTGGAPQIFWDGSGANPYPHFLAAADVLVVTGDSVNMCGEACATGRPVVVFHPSGGSAKFKRFHDGLENQGAARPMPERFEALPDWTYTPLHSAQRIAGEVERRYALFRGADAADVGVPSMTMQDPVGGANAAASSNEAS